jgi:hypothetical protein
VIFRTEGCDGESGVRECMKEGRVRDGVYGVHWGSTVFEEFSNGKVVLVFYGV